jgi:hypothetical protein
MSCLAKERFPSFGKVFEKERHEPETKSFSKKIFNSKEEQPKWSFLVKLGLTVDDVESGSEKEHL